MKTSEGDYKKAPRTRQTKAIKNNKRQPGKGNSCLAIGRPSRRKNELLHVHHEKSQLAKKGSGQKVLKEQGMPKIERLWTG
jgi:hypothetical protein